MWNLTLSDWFGLIVFLLLIGVGVWVGVVQTIVDIVRCMNEKD